MKKGILFIFWVLIISGIYPQTITNIDSAKRVLQTAKDDTAKVNLLYQVTLLYTSSNNDSALIYATKEYELAEKINYAKGLANAYYHFHYYNSILGNGAQSLEYAYKMLPIAQQLKDSALLAVCYSAIARGYSDLNNNKEGLLWQKKAYLAVASSSDLVNKAGQLSNMGTAYSYVNQHDSSLLCFQQSYRIFDSLNDKMNLAFPLSGLVMTSFALNKPEDVKMYGRQLISIEKLTGRTAFLGSAYYFLAKQYLKEHKKDSTLYFARRSAAIAQSFNAKSGLVDVNNVLVQAFQLNHQPDSALKYEAQILQLKDSIVAENNRSQLRSFAFEEKMRDKEKADAVQKAKEGLRNQVIVFSLLAVLIIFGVIAFILYKNNAQKQKANRLLQQQKQQIEDTLGELKSTQAQLIQSEKMASLGELTAGIAHEIQNPLNFVNNFSEINTELIEELKSQKSKVKSERDDKLEEELLNDLAENEQKINHHGKRADSIVKGMLQHSRANTGKKELTNINALVDECLRLSYHGLRAKDKDFNAQITTDFDSSVGEINIIPQDISRILLNLFNNAFYAVNEKKKAPTLKGENYKPTVTVTTKRISSPLGAGGLEVSVKDNGNGIPQNIINKIFQPFFTTKPTGQGTGLGLSLSYDIIKAHSGEIKVESSEGEGTTFSILLATNMVPK